MPSNNPNAELAWVALGSNLGDSPQIIRQAFGELQKLSAGPLQTSSLWQTTPVNCPPESPPFVNAVVGLEVLPNETPESLLEKLQALEKEFGRRPKTILNEARPLDLDLIAFKHATRNTQPLILPHPRAHQRRFVLEPLSEIAPDLILPGQFQTVRQLLQVLPPDSGMSKLADGVGWSVKQ